MTILQWILCASAHYKNIICEHVHRCQKYNLFLTIKVHCKSMQLLLNITTISNHEFGFLWVQDLHIIMKNKWNYLLPWGKMFHNENSRILRTLLRTYLLQRRELRAITIMYTRLIARIRVCPPCVYFTPPMRRNALPAFLYTTAGNFNIIFFTLWYARWHELIFYSIWWDLSFCKCNWHMASF